MQILQNRLHLALGTKQRAVDDSKALRTRIKEQGQKLEALRRKQAELERLENALEAMMRENVMIRRDIQRHSECT